MKPSLQVVHFLSASHVLQLRTHPVTRKEHCVLIKCKSNPYIKLLQLKPITYFFQTEQFHLQSTGSHIIASIETHHTITNIKIEQAATYTTTHALLTTAFPIPPKTKHDREREIGGGRERKREKVTQTTTVIVINIK